MVVNDNECLLVKRGAHSSIASELAPTVAVVFSYCSRDNAPKVVVWVFFSIADGVEGFCCVR